MSDGQDDLDAFLTLLESKLRGPFSSLDLAKTITTPQLRGSLSITQYIRNVAEVLSRTEKSTQLSVLIGLLGLDPSDDIDNEIHALLTNAQVKSQYVEEWVRVVSGLVHGLMFKGTNDQDRGDSDEYDDELKNRNQMTIQLRGKEANDILEKTCTEIIARVRRIECESADMTKGRPEKMSSLALDDADPTFAPFRYALLRSDLLNKCLFEVERHNHFHVDEDSEVLTMDSKLESIKAQEEYEHSLQAAPPLSNDGGTKKASLPEEPQAILPGMNRKTALSSSNRPNSTDRPKNNLFIPAKKPAFTTVPNTKLQKPGLKIRKAGAAQDLLKSKKNRLMGSSGMGGNAPGAPGSTKVSLNSSNVGTSSGTASAIARGRANRLLQSTGASRMKMLDANEAKGLEMEKFEKEQQLTNKLRKKVPPPVTLKRKAPLLSNGNSNQSKVRSKVAKMDENGNNDYEEEDIKNIAPNQKTAADNHSFANLHNDDDDEGAIHHNDPQNTATNGFLNIHNNEDYGDDTQQDTKPAATKSPDKIGTAPFTSDAGALAAAVLGAYQAQLMQRHPTQAGGIVPSPAGVSTGAPTSATAAPPPNAPAHRQHDWRLMLKEKSNKLSSEDRFRIQQFFVDRYNPTPDQSTYKMKLHEERTTDPKSGEPVKETYYLELDYTTFTSKQSKKVKRY